MPRDSRFESLKQINENNAEWRWFEQAIERAMTSCDASGNQAAHHFARTGKPIFGGAPARHRCSNYSMAVNLKYLKRTIGVSLW